MIKLERNINQADIPSSFTSNGKRGRELHLLKEVRNKLINPKYKIKYQDWGATKKNLLNESKDKCAYCESNFPTVAYGDVEHFRPKSKYWWLAYCYVNYLASCQLCNQKYKRDKFPINGNKLIEPVNITSQSSDLELQSHAGNLAPDPFSRQQLAQFEIEHNNEIPLLIDPYFDDPAEYFGYSFNDDLKEVRLIPLNQNVIQKVKKSIEVFGLNRQKLRKKRWSTLRFYRIFREMKEKGDEKTPEVDYIIRTMKSKDHEYSGMINFFEGEATIDSLSLDLV